MNNKIPDLMLEQYLLGELKQSEIEKLEKALVRDDLLKKRLGDIEKNQAIFSSHYPADWLRQKISQKSSRADIKFPFFKVSAVPILCTLLIIPLVFLSMSRLNFKLPSSERTKGDILSFSVYRKTDLGHDLLSNGAVVRQNDLLQIEYSVYNSTLYGMIISIDGNGHNTIHLGTDDGTSVRLSQLHKMLPFSYELDDAPDFEKFYFITSKNRFVLNDCILLCKKMNKQILFSTQFTIKSLTFNKVSSME